MINEIDAISAGLAIVGCYGCDGEPEALRRIFRRSVFYRMRAARQRRDFEKVEVASNVNSLRWSTRGTLLLSSHFGCFATAAAALAREGRPAAIVSAGRNAEIEAMLEANGVAILRAANRRSGLGLVRDVTKTLSSGRSVILLIDAPLGGGASVREQVAGRVAIVSRIARFLVPVLEEDIRFLEIDHRSAGSAVIGVSAPLSKGREVDEAFVRLNDLIVKYPHKYIWTRFPSIMRDERAIVQISNRGEFAFRWAKELCRDNNVDAR